MSAPKIVVITMNTRHFTFTAAGNTPTEAKKALVAAWTVHLSQMPEDVKLAGNVVKASYAALDKNFEVTLQEMVLGQGYRDGTRITT